MKSSEVSVKKAPDSCYLFIDFRRLINQISCEDDKDQKLEILKTWIIRAEGDKKYKVDLQLFCQLLVPKSLKRESKIKNPQIIKIFAELFRVDPKDMANTAVEKSLDKCVKFYFENNTSKYIPAEFSTLTIREVYNFIQDMSSTARHTARKDIVRRILPVCTGNDLRILVCLLKRDLQMNLTAKQLAEALSPRTSRNFRSVRDFHKVLRQFGTNTRYQPQPHSLNFLNNPISPMLAEPCRSVDQALIKCPKGLFAEIKYDGERTQVHKKGHRVSFFSRNLKPVSIYKVESLQFHVLQAFQNVGEIILDSELVIIDPTEEMVSLAKQQDNTGSQTGQCCLVVFDCLYIDGNSLLQAPLKKRRRILEEAIIEIKNKVILSEKQFIEDASELANVIAKALNAGVEGLVLKDISGIYTSGKRQWLKIKKDYLYEGKYVDSADLVVLGAWFGAETQSNLMARFLMGCYDEDNGVFCTVTTVSNCFSEDVLCKLHNEFEHKMTQINQDPAKCPLWLVCSTLMVPDWVAKDPRNQPVWEITGAEFTQHEVHTADGISMRFPKVTRIRDDKSWADATTLNELKVLVTMSNKKSVFQMLQGQESTYDGNDDDYAETNPNPNGNDINQQGENKEPTDSYDNRFYSRYPRRRRDFRSCRDYRDYYRGDHDRFRSRRWY